MSGYNALWVPGVDHAGIATQVCISEFINLSLCDKRYNVADILFQQHILSFKLWNKHIETHAGSASWQCADIKRTPSA
jgi:valyl-tRNA synthetase